MTNFNSQSSNGHAADSEKHSVTLSAADAAIVDQLLDQPDTAPLELSSNRSSATPQDTASNTQRREQVQRILNTLGSAPEPQIPANLLARTLATVKADTLHLHGPDRSAQQRDKEEAAGQSMNLSRRLSQLGAVAIAASILIAVLIPGLGQLRQKAYIAECASNLREFQSAFGSYASANAGVLPKLDNGDGNWLPHPEGMRGPGHSNTANLLPLIQHDFIKEAALICPGRGGSLHIDGNTREIANAQVGYSYANMFGPIHPSWDGKSSTIVLADHNPLFGPDASDDAQSNTCNHRFTGSNVLAADGSVVFASTPDVGPNGDNIWTVQEGNSYHLKYTGTEVVRSASDVFLAP